MKLIQSRLKLKIRGTGLAWPEIQPTHTIEILKAHPDYTGKESAILERLSESIKKTYGFEYRFLTRKPWEPRSTEEESSESLGFTASSRCLASHSNDLNKTGVEAFVFGSTTNRRYTGSQATAVLGKLGICAPAYDIKAGCSTSLASLHLAQGLLAQGYGNVLVSCAETLSKVIHPEIRETWVGLGDGAASLWLEKDETNPDFIVLGSAYSTDGTYVDLYTTSGDLPPTREALERHGYCLSGDGSQLKTLAQEKYREMIQLFKDQIEETQQIKWVIPHQVNRNLITEVLKEAGINASVAWIADQYGNLGGASVLFALAKSLRDGAFQPGDVILLTSVGGGLSFATQLWMKT